MQTPRQYAKILFDLTKDADKKSIDEFVHIFLDYVKKDQAVKKISAIIEAFDAYSKEVDGVVSADVVFAREFSERQIKGMRKLLGDTVETTTSVDPSQVGGIVVRTRNMILDGSVRAQMNRLYNNLITDTQ